MSEPAMSVHVDYEAAAKAQTRACLACMSNDETGQEPCEDCVLDAHAVVNAALPDGELWQIRLPDARIDPDVKDMMWSHITAAQNYGLLVKLERGNP